MPGTPVYVDELIQSAVASDQIMRTDLPSRVGEGLEGMPGVVARRVVENHAVRPTFIVVGRGKKEGAF